MTLLPCFRNDKCWGASPGGTRIQDAMPARLSQDSDGHHVRVLEEGRIGATHLRNAAVETGRVLPLVCRPLGVQGSLLCAMKTFSGPKDFNLAQFYLNIDRNMYSLWKFTSISTETCIHCWNLCGYRNDDALWDIYWVLWNCYFSGGYDIAVEAVYRSRANQFIYSDMVQLGCLMLVRNWSGIVVSCYCWHWWNCNGAVSERAFYNHLEWTCS